MVGISRPRGPAGCAGGRARARCPRPRARRSSRPPRPRGAGPRRRRSAGSPGSRSPRPPGPRRRHGGCRRRRSPLPRAPRCGPESLSSPCRPANVRYNTSTCRRRRLLSREFRSWYQPRISSYSSLSAKRLLYSIPARTSSCWASSVPVVARLHQASLTAFSTGATRSSSREMNALYRRQEKARRAQRAARSRRLPSQIATSRRTMPSVPNCSSPSGKPWPPTASAATKTSASAAYPAAL